MGLSLYLQRFSNLSLSFCYLIKRQCAEATNLLTIISHLKAQQTYLIAPLINFLNKAVAKKVTPRHRCLPILIAVDFTAALLQGCL